MNYEIRVTEKWPHSADVVSGTGCCCGLVFVVSSSSPLPPPPHSSSSSHHPSIYPSSPPPTPPNAEEFQPGGAGVKKGRAEGRRGAPRNSRPLRGEGGREGEGGGAWPRYYLTEKKKRKPQKKKEGTKKYKKTGKWRTILLQKVWWISTFPPCG